jgi:hypothetical protein
VTALVLPADFGRVLGPGEKPAPVEWLSDQVIAKGGVSAFAVSDQTARIQLGRAVLRDCLPPAEESGSPVQSVVILATSRHAAWSYQEEFGNDERVQIVSVDVGMWSAAGGRWTELREAIQTTRPELLVVDSTTDLEVRSGASPCTLLAEMGATVVALMRGNTMASKAYPAGGEHLWDAAWPCFYLKPGTSDLECITDPDLSRTVDLTPRVGLSAIIDPEADKVYRTALLAKTVTQDTDAGRALRELTIAQLEGIWGAGASVAGVLPAFGRHRPAWDAGLKGLPIPAPTDEPNF